MQYDRLSDYVWLYYNRIEVSEFMDLVEEGKALPLDIPEIDEIIELGERIKLFLEKSEAEVKKGPQIDHLQNLMELVSIKGLVICSPQWIKL
jgi:hypothetical protein